MPHKKGPLRAQRAANHKKTKKAKKPKKKELQERVLMTAPTTSNIFPQFKANQGLSYSDVTRIFKCTFQEARAWSKGSAPQHIEEIAFICNEVVEHSKRDAMSDIDVQHFEREKNKILDENKLLNEEVEILKVKIAQFEDIKELREAGIIFEGKLETVKGRYSEPQGLLACNPSKT